MYKQAANSGDVHCFIMLVRAGVKINNEGADFFEVFVDHAHRVFHVFLSLLLSCSRRRCLSRTKKQ